MKKIERTYNLTAQNIHDALLEIRKILISKNRKNDEISKICILIEETLLEYLDLSNSYKKFIVEFHGGFSHYVKLIIPGESHCPFDSGDEFQNLILKQLDNFHTWGYKNNSNLIKIRLGANPLKNIFWSIIMVMLGVALACLLPRDFAYNANEIIIKPISDLILNIIWRVGCILVFTNIIISIYNIGNLNKFKKIFSSIMMIILAFLILDSILAILITLPFVDSNNASTAYQSDNLKTYVDMFISFCPQDIFSPFTNGNAMQVLVMSVVIGIICLILDNSVKKFIELIEQIDLIFVKLINALGKIIPIMVFTLVFGLFVNNDVDTISQSLKIIIVLVIVWLLVMVVTMVFICITSKVSIKNYFKKITNPILIALFTSSIFASMESNTNVCTDDLGVDNNLCRLGLPVTQIFYKAFMNVFLIVSAIIIASISGVYSAWGLPILAIYCVLLSISAPPVPGGLIPIVSLLFSQFGLPSDYLGLVLSIAIIIDPFGSAFGVSAQQKVLVIANKILNKYIT